MNNWLCPLPVAYVAPDAHIASKDAHNRLLKKGFTFQE